MSKIPSVLCLCLLAACGSGTASLVEPDAIPPTEAVAGPGGGVVVGSPNKDDDGDGVSENGGDCDDSQPAISPMATDLVGDGVDQNCDGADGIDGDGDGFANTVSGGTDCDDTDLFAFPGALEIWYDGVDQGCLGAEWAGDGDQDGDGYDAEEVGGDDCDDTRPAVHPDIGDLPENGVDDNCNGLTDASLFTVEWAPGGTVTYTLTDATDGDTSDKLMVVPLVQSASDDIEEVYFDVVGGVGVYTMDSKYGDEWTTLTYLYTTYAGFGPYPAYSTLAWGHRPVEVCTSLGIECTDVSGDPMFPDPTE